MQAGIYIRPRFAIPPFHGLTTTNISNTTFFFTTLNFVCLSHFEWFSLIPNMAGCSVQPKLLKAHKAEKLRAWWCD